MWNNDNFLKSMFTTAKNYTETVYLNDLKGYLRYLG